MQEDTRVDAAQPDRVLVLDASKPWENVRFRGEDVKRGAAVALEGDLLTPSRMALLAATGCAEAMTRRRPVVGLIATGSELREGGASLGPGQIYESNRLTLASLARQAGTEPKIYPLVVDELSAIKSLLVQALSECDAVVSSGGVSVGELDLVKPAFEAIGGELQFWKVAIKPGKPFVLGQRQGKLLFGLPGNPVSAFVTFLLLVRPALLQFQGSRAVGLAARPGIMAEHVSNSGDRRHFLRVNLGAGGQVRSSGRQASHLLNSLAGANGLLDLPPGSTVEPGTAVQVLAWD
jgi:molybdopterin molybdotransferase